MPNERKRIVIGIGHRRRQGKDTLASLLRLAAPVKLACDWFAYPLKEQIGRQIFGFSEEQLYHGEKDIKDPFWDLTPGAAFQKAGQAMRDAFGGDYWARALLRRDEERRKSDAEWTQLEAGLVVPDMRYPEEVSAIRFLGGVLIKIERPGLVQDGGRDDRHSSETALEDFDGWDYTVLNNGTLLDLERAARYVMEQILADYGWAE